MRLREHAWQPVAASHAQAGWTAPLFHVKSVCELFIGWLCRTVLSRDVTEMSRQGLTRAGGRGRGVGGGGGWGGG